MAGTYTVAAACVVAKVASDTGEGYFYRGAVLPDGVPQEEKDRLTEAGLVTFELDTDTAPDDESPGGGGTRQIDVDKLSLDEARETARQLGLSADGKVADLRAAIKRHLGS